MPYSDRRNLYNIFCLIYKCYVEESLRDYVYSLLQEIYFNEINTIPGFTSHSRFPNMMRGAGYTFEKLVEKLIEQGMKE